MGVMKDKINVEEPRGERQEARLVNFVVRRLLE
jgi:hypothetical protein